VKKAESNAELAKKEQELIRRLVVADSMLSELPNEDFNTELDDLEKVCLN
jgi:hypothetical protein